MLERLLCLLHQRMDEPSTKRLIESKESEKASTNASIIGCRESRAALERDTEAAVKAKAADVVASGLQLQLTISI